MAMFVKVHVLKHFEFSNMDRHTVQWTNNYRVSFQLKTKQAEKLKSHEINMKDKSWGMKDERWSIKEWLIIFICLKSNHQN